MLFASFPSWSQKTYRLNDIESSDHLDKVTFYYHGDSQLEWYDLTTPDGSTKLDVRDSLFYDVHGNISRINTYKWLNDTWYHCCIVDYGYDENNHRINRTNYNNQGNGFEKHGVYTYTYDTSGQLIHHELELVGIPLEKCDYSYTNGKLTTEESKTYEPNIGIWSNSSRTTYEYDGDNLTNIYYEWWDGASWSVENSTILTYDDQGNCLSRTYFTGNIISDRIYYKYNTDIEINQVIMPVHPEPFYRRFDQFKSMPLSYSWETVDEDNVLQYICDFNFN